MTSTVIELITSILICGTGVVAAGLYFAMRYAGQTLEPTWLVRLESAEGRYRRRHRRDLGMALTLIVSLAFFWAINYMDPLRTPTIFVIYIAIILLLICWLCLLAVADIRHSLQMVRALSRERLEKKLERYLQSLDKGSVPSKYRESA